MFSFRIDTVRSRVACDLQNLGPELPRIGSKRRIPGGHLTPTQLHSPSGAGED